MSVIQIPGDAGTQATTMLRQQHREIERLQGLHAAIEQDRDDKARVIGEQAAKIERLQKEIATRKQFMRWVYDSEASPSEWEWLLQELEASRTENELLQDKIERLRAENAKLNEVVADYAYGRRH